MGLASLLFGDGGLTLTGHVTLEELDRALPGVMAGSIMVFLPSMGLFYIPDLLGGAKSMLVGNFIKNQLCSCR